MGKIGSMNLLVDSYCNLWHSSGHTQEKSEKSLRFSVSGLKKLLPNYIPFAYFSKANAAGFSIRISLRVVEADIKVEINFEVSAYPLENISDAGLSFDSYRYNQGLILTRYLTIVSM